MAIYSEAKEQSKHEDLQIKLLLNKEEKHNIEKPVFHKTFEPPRNTEMNHKEKKDKLTEKMNKMENDINMLKEI